MYHLLLLAGPLIFGYIRYGKKWRLLTLARPIKQYFKSIEQVAKTQGFEQILPSKMRTGTVPIAPRVVLDEEVQAPTVHAPKPVTSSLLHALTPAAEYPVRSVSPDLVPDRMGSRIPGDSEAAFHRRLTPNPEQQDLHKQKLSHAFVSTQLVV